MYFKIPKIKRSKIKMENEGWFFFVLNKHNKHEQNIKYKLMRCNNFKKRAGNTEQKGEQLYMKDSSCYFF